MVGEKFEVGRLIPISNNDINNLNLKYSYQIPAQAFPSRENEFYFYLPGGRQAEDYLRRRDLKIQSCFRQTLQMLPT